MRGVALQTSTTYNSFMYLSLPVPTNKIQKISLQHCLDAFFKEEVMEKSDAWYAHLTRWPDCRLTNTSFA